MKRLSSEGRDHRPSITEGIEGDDGKIGSYTDDSPSMLGEEGPEAADDTTRAEDDAQEGAGQDSDSDDDLLGPMVKLALYKY